jgi:hypothetical protein
MYSLAIGILQTKVMYFKVCKIWTSTLRRPTNLTQLQSCGGYYSETLQRDIVHWLCCLR